MGNSAVMIIPLAALCAYSVTGLAQESNSPKGNQTGTMSPQAQKSLNGLAQGGVLSKGQVATIKKDVAGAAQKAAAANESMANEAQGGPANPGAQPAPGAPGAPGGPQMKITSSQPGANPNPASLPPPKPVQTWRLEGTVLGGNHKPSAVFDEGGFMPVILHPGQHIDPEMKVARVNNDSIVLSDSHNHHFTVFPW